MPDPESSPPSATRAIEPRDFFASSEGPLAGVSGLTLVDGEFSRPAQEREESLLLILSGTCDVFAASSVWRARGGRATVFEGPPTAVFVPVGTAFRVRGVRTELLWIRGRVEPQPATERPSREPLTSGIPMYGTSKAFDPRTGAMVDAASFTLAPEARAPRHHVLERPGKAIEVRWIAPPDYKAQTLVVGEGSLGPSTKASIHVQRGEGAARASSRTWVWGVAAAETRDGAIESDLRLELRAGVGSSIAPTHALPWGPEPSLRCLAVAHESSEALTVEVANGTSMRSWFAIIAASSNKEWLSVRTELNL
jgi:hypothetical protein